MRNLAEYSKFQIILENDKTLSILVHLKFRYEEIATVTVKENKYMASDYGIKV